MLDRLTSRHSTPSLTIRHALAAGVVVSCFGCTQLVEPTSDGIGQAKEDLYLVGRTWPSGTVFVCYDTSDGNNATLIAEAQRVLADSWSRAASVTFPGRISNGAAQTNWGPCDYSFRGSGGTYSTVAVHFCGGSSNSSACPAYDYDSGFVQSGHFRGLSSAEGIVGPFQFPPFGSAPGITHVSLIADDPDSFQTRFRYEVIHEFGHALGFEHEQDRPDNFTTAGNPIFCNQSAVNTPGGTVETPFFDVASIMDYCAGDPLTGGFPNMLSSGDILGVRYPYGRRWSSHGFMILSDTNSTLAVNAWGGAAEGTVLRLHNGCSITNPDCTWSYQRGMLVSDTDPSLAINAYGGAAEGTVLRLTRACTQGNPDCTWTYKAGEFVSDRDPTLAINAYGGAQFGTTLKLTRACTAGNPDCTWTMPHVMLSSHRDSTLAVNAFNGATNGTALRLHDACDPSNPDCTWTFSKGMILSDTNTALAMNAYGGAQQLGSVQLTNACSASNSDCTWTWNNGQLISDNKANGTFPINALNGAVHLAGLKLNSACTASNPDCVFSGLFGRN